MKDNLKYKERDVLTATDNSVLVLEPNTSFVNVLKRITGLAILLCTFLFHTENINAMEIKVRYWKTNMDFTEITDSCRVWVFSRDSTPMNRTELIQVEGSFILNKELTKDLTFEVKDHLDSIYQIRLLHVPKGASEVYLEIGKSEFTFYPIYQPRPFFPIEDKVFIQIIDTKMKTLYPNASIEENQTRVSKKLRSLGFKYRRYPREGYGVYEFDTTKNIRAAIEELLELDYIHVAPMVAFEHKGGRNSSYLLNRVDVLCNDTLSTSMIKDKLNLEGVLSIYPSNRKLNVVWRKFDTGKAYQIFFKPEAVISLEFLKELEQLATKEGILSIKTQIGRSDVGE